MGLKVTYKFNNVAGSAGWSETFYVDANAITDQIFERVSGFANVNTYVRRRLKLLANSYYLVACTVSNEDILRDSRVEVYKFADGVGKFAGGENRTEVVPDPATLGEGELPFDAVQIRIEAGDTTRRTLDMRGIPDGVVTSGLKYDPVPGWNTAFSNWSLAVIAAGFSIRNVRRKIIGGAPAPIYSPTSIDIGTDQKSLVLTFADMPAGWAVNTLFRIKKIDNTVGISGMWKVLRTDAVAKTITTYPHLSKLYGTAVGPFQIYEIALTYATITRLQPQRGRKRDTGRPSGLLVGKRPAQRR